MLPLHHVPDHCMYHLVSQSDSQVIFTSLLGKDKVCDCLLLFYPNILMPLAVFGPLLARKLFLTLFTSLSAGELVHVSSFQLSQLLSWSYRSYKRLFTKNRLFCTFVARSAGFSAVLTCLVNDPSISTDYLTARWQIAMEFFLSIDSGLCVLRITDILSP